VPKIIYQRNNQRKWGVKAISFISSLLIYQLKFSSILLRESVEKEQLLVWLNFSEMSIKKAPNILGASCPLKKIMQVKNISFYKF